MQYDGNMPMAAQDEAGNNAPRTVLVVEDEVDLVNTYGRLLQRLGRRMTVARTRREGLAALATSPFELVIADVRLPDGDGLDVVRVAHALAQPPPIIVVTGFPSGENRQQALAAGATAFVSKPFSVAAFSSLIGGKLAPGSG